MAANKRRSSDQEILEQARETLATESRAVTCLADRLDEDFLRAVKFLLAMDGRAIVCGIGKSGAIGRKLAGTLASTGTPAYFMQAAEAVHGDLGMVYHDDVVIVITASGETDEVLRLLPILKRRGARLIAICGNRSSTVAREADVVLDASVEREACPLGLAPTSSTIAELAMGDALAMALMRARGFSVEEFGETHPAGQLGKRALLRVEDLMHGGDDNPTVGLDATVLDALLEMTDASVRGVVTVVGEGGSLEGLFTDGDFRVLMQKEHDRNAVMARPIVEVMTTSPTTVQVGTLGTEAVRMMEEREFDNMPVVDDQGRAVGMLDIQDLMKAGIV
jgi:arabinose-5-phosphate isomerase